MRGLYWVNYKLTRINCNLAHVGLVSTQEVIQRLHRHSLVLNTVLDLLTSAKPRRGGGLTSHLGARVATVNQLKCVHRRPNRIYWADQRSLLAVDELPKYKSPPLFSIVSSGILAGKEFLVGDRYALGVTGSALWKALGVGLGQPRAHILSSGTTEISSGLCLTWHRQIVRPWSKSW